MRAAGWTLATILGAILVVALGFGAWKLGWWIKEYSVNKNTQINNESLARQQGLRQDVINKYQDIKRIDVQIIQSPEVKDLLEAQRKAEVGALCSSYGQLTGSLNIDPNIQSFTQLECP